MADTKVPVTIEPKEPKSFNPTVSDVNKKAEYLSRMTEKGLINETSGSSIALRDNGQVNLTAGRYSHVKLNPAGSIDETSMQHSITTNRLNINSNEITINQHKFNQHLIELSDFRKVNIDMNDNAVVGNFCVNGTVLVKAWEHNLKRYVLIRRPARISLFGPQLNVPELHKGMDIDDPLYMPADLVGISEKGYQVNSEISDAASLIGKEGADRAGIVRSSGGVVGTSTSSSSSSGGSVTSIGTLGGNSVREKVWSFLKAEGFTDEGAAGVMGNIQQESQFDPDLHEYGGEGYGLVQWTDPGRKDGLYQKAKEMGKDVSDLEVQLAFIKEEAISYGVWDKCKTSTDYKSDPTGSTAIWHDEYEISGDRENFGNINKRIDYADQIYKAYAGKTFAAESTSKNNSSSQAETDKVDMTGATDFEFTAYCPDGSDMEGGFSTASGMSLEGKEQSAHIIAVDPDIIPLGSKVYISFNNPDWQKWNGIYSAEDTGGAIKQNIIDIFVGCYQYDLANQFGRQHGKVKIISKGG